MRVRTVDSNRARIHWRDVLDTARAGQDSVIEHYGRPTAAVIPYADYEALQEELDDLRATRSAAAAVADWERDPSLGTPLDQVEAELRAEGLLEVTPNGGIRVSHPDERVEGITREKLLELLRSSRDNLPATPPGGSGAGKPRHV